MSSVSSSEAIRTRLDRIRAEVGPSVTVVAATKYVALEDMARLLDAGIDVVGENRAQDLEAKHAVYGDAFRWHFIGRLQSNKAKVVNRICELVHSLDSESTARRLEVPALVQVNLAGEATRAASRPTRSRRCSRSPTSAGSRRCRPRRPIPSSRGRTSGGCASSPSSTASSSSRSGRARTTASRPRRAPPSSASDPACCGDNIRGMPLGDLWNRTLVYFGIAEEEDDWDEDSYEAEERARAAATRAGERPPADAARAAARRRRLERLRPGDGDRAATVRPAREPRQRSRPPPGIEAVPGGSAAVKVHLVLPRSFNDAQQIADKFKQSIPVILNLQNADTELSKRLIDFASGLTYALNGGMQRVADKVFLLDAAQRRGLRGGARAPARGRRLLQPGVVQEPPARPRKRPRGR